MPDLFLLLNKHFRVRIHRDDGLPYRADRPRRVDGRTLLARVLRDMQVRVGAEIGVCQGISAKCWCDTNPNLHLTCIDSWVGRRRQRDMVQAQATLAPYTVTILRRPSMNAVRLFADDSLDFVHIDGNHSFDDCSLDLILWSHKLKTGGLMAVHDYHAAPGGGVVEAVNAYTRGHHIDPWCVIADRLPTAVWLKP